MHLHALFYYDIVWWSMVNFTCACLLALTRWECCRCSHCRCCRACSLRTLLYRSWRRLLPALLRCQHSTRPWSQWQRPRSSLHLLRSGTGGSTSSRRSHETTEKPRFIRHSARGRGGVVRRHSTVGVGEAAPVGDSGTSGCIGRRGAACCSDCRSPLVHGRATAAAVRQLQ